jgi:hypothetical protein
MFNMDDAININNATVVVSATKDTSNKGGDAIRWEGYEYLHSEKSVDWYWAVGIVALSGAVAAFLLGDFLFGVLILLSAFTLSLFTARKPQIVSFEINRRGVLIDKKLFPYNTLDSFWLHEEGDQPTLIIKSKKTLMPLVMIPLNQTLQIDDVHMYLVRFLEEEEQELPVSHRLVEYLGF